MNRLCLAPVLRRPQSTWSRVPLHKIRALRAYSTPSTPSSSSSGRRASAYTQTIEPIQTLESAQSVEPTQTAKSNVPSRRSKKKKSPSSETPEKPVTLFSTPINSLVSGHDVSFPDLNEVSWEHDAELVEDFPPTSDSPFHNRVVLRSYSDFQGVTSRDHLELLDPEDWKRYAGPNGGQQPRDIFDDEDAAVDDEDNNPERSLDMDDEVVKHPIPEDIVSSLHTYPLITRRVTQQTGKGKIHSMYTLVVVGNGDGLVGYGEGKDDDVGNAHEKAYAKALRSMDFVDRFEERTLWTDLESKFGSTKILLRPRPVGFGLRTNPYIHQILKAAGIKDASAKVWGSRNPLMVVKALFRMLHDGHAPLSMGDGVGGGMRRLDKGSGLRNKQAIERDRGRKMIDLRTL